MTDKEDLNNMSGVNIKYKICNTCKLEFPLTPQFFYRNKSYKDGFFGHCKQCDKIKTRDNKKRYYNKTKKKWYKYSLNKRLKNKEWYKKSIEIAKKCHKRNSSPYNFKCVYFISENRSYIKIGKCSNIYNTISSIQRGNPRKLKIEGIIRSDNNTITESSIHHLFDEYRVKREGRRCDWFIFNKKIKDYIKQNTEKIILNKRQHIVIK
jgi:hypothetical protein